MGIRACSIDTDEGPLLALWQSALGDFWPVAPGAFRSCLQRGSHFLAERAGVPIGLVATQTGGPQAAPTASITALVVRRDQRGDGVGTHLFRTAVTALRQRGAREIVLGGLPGPYFWPGVPTNLEAAQRFFERRGAAFTNVRTDMKLDLSGYATPPGIMQRAAAAAVWFSVARPQDAEDVMQFESTHFPRWLGSYASVLEASCHDQILLARDRAGALVGTALVEPPSPAFAWERLIPGAGQIGVVGVAKSERGRGIGLALSARACELSKERGVSEVYLAWVWSPAWYAQLGFRIWRVYLGGSLP